MEDFKMVNPGDNESPYGANTSHYIEVDYTFFEKMIKYNISEYFEKDSSWMKLYPGAIFNKQENELNNYQKTRGLKHEQGHFDLGEVYARKLRCLLANYKYINDQKKVSDSVDVILDRLKEMEKKYDHETVNSQDSIGQNKWNVKIQKMLDSLKAYSNPTGTVILK